MIINIPGRNKNAMLAMIKRCLIGLFLLSFSSYSLANSTPIGWGGGGAFSSFIQFNETEYLASDVAGVWRKENNQWTPYVEGLENYNVTKLTTFNNALVAITTDALFISDGQGAWSNQHIPLNTYRGITDYPVVHTEDLMCIASREFTITCIDDTFQSSTITTDMEKIKGLKLTRNDPGKVLAFGGTSLYVLQPATQSLRLLKQYTDPVIAVTHIDGKTLIATTKGIYDLNDSTQTPIYTPKSGRLVNVFSGPYKDSGNVIFIGQGNQWKMHLYAFSLNGPEMQKIAPVPVNVDARLPHRKYQKQLTKLLDIYAYEGQLWVSDYWGLYSLTPDEPETLQEVTQNAINTVATDLVVAPEHVYISTMDVGVVKANKPAGTSGEFELITPASLRGHAWSLRYTPDTLQALFSPWNKPDDYVLTFSETEQSTSVTQLTQRASRESEGTFWGKSYARQLFDLNGLGAFSDGKNGGFVFEKGHTKKQASLTVGNNNRVFRAIGEHEGALYVGTCDSDAAIYQFDQALNQTAKIQSPSGFCPFRLYKQQSNLFFLGSMNGQSVIFQLIDDQLHELVSTPKGSAFYAMAVNPANHTQIAAATTTWSNKSTSTLMVSVNGGESFVDNSCLLTHKNGVAQIAITNNTAFIQQKVGGIIKVDTRILFSQQACQSA